MTRTRSPGDADTRTARDLQLPPDALTGRQTAAHFRLLAAEQTALRRVAQLVAGGAAQTAVLDAIVAEAFELFSVDFTALLRYEPDGAAAIIAVHHGPPGLAVGDPAPHIPDGLVLRVFDSGQPARVDAYAHLTGPEVARMYTLGITAGAAAPIVVEGSLWGVLAAMTRAGTVGAGLEHHLADFAELAATAVAAAQAKDDLQGLVDEQAALRRVAELAAGGARPEDVFEALAAEASTLMRGGSATLARTDGDRAAIMLAVSGDHSAVHRRTSLTGDNVAPRVQRSGQPARIEDYADAPESAANARGQGVRAGVTVPITVDGRVWGMLTATSGDEPLPHDTERRLSQFVEIASATISSATSRGELRQLADEHAALRWVAELVARGVSLEEVFAAVADEASKLLGAGPVTLLRYDPDGSAISVAACNSRAAHRMRLPAEKDTAIGGVALSRRPIRVDSYAGTPLAGITDELRSGTEVAVPITVAGRVWGALTTSAAGHPLPPGTEARLEQFAELAAAAIATAENKAQLTASRARVVATADDTRRRLQRDVHDGAQQRLVQTIITLKLARDTAAGGSSATELINEALYHADRANTELRNLVHGILPASLTQGGLRTGIESLVEDIAIPVQLQMAALRLPTETETTAYFVVAEALTNVVKHACATHAHITVEVNDGRLSVEVRDDGTGGADPAHGSGLTGLSDRVQAAEGVLTITSDPESGTTLHASLPVEPVAPD